MTPKRLLTLGRALQAWEASMKAARRSPRTIQNYTDTLGRVIEAFGADVDPATITTGDLEELLGSWTHLSPTTIKLHRSALVSFYRFGRKRYGWPDPTRDLDTIQAADPVLRRLTTPEVRAMLAAPVEPRIRLLTAIYAYTGARRTEGLELRWGDVDFVTATLTIRHGKGRKSRRVPIHADLATLLALHPDGVPTDVIQMDYVTPYRTGHRFGHLPTYDYTRRAGMHVAEEGIKHAAEAGGVRRPREITPHMLRRWLAETLLEDGESIYVVAALLGHASIQTTARYGGGASLQNVARALRKLNVSARAQGSTQPLQPALSSEGEESPSRPNEGAS